MLWELQELTVMFSRPSAIFKLPWQRNMNQILFENLYSLCTNCPYWSLGRPYREPELPFTFFSDLQDFLKEYASKTMGIKSYSCWPAECWFVFLFIFIWTSHSNWTCKPLTAKKETYSCFWFSSRLQRLSINFPEVDTMGLWLRCQKSHCS